MIFGVNMNWSDFMGSILKLVSPIPPSVNHYMSYRGVMKNKKPLAVPYKTGEAKKYQSEFAKYVKQEAKKQGWQISDNKYQHYYVDAIFYFPRIDMDCNNYWKCMFDAITDSKAVWLDDTQACERVQAIYYSSTDPRIEIEIHPVDYIGVFKNSSQLEEFESNCIGCSRYERNCSLLKKAKEGRIQEEINSNNCACFKEVSS